jgi:hypothetical protein
METNKSNGSKSDSLAAWKKRRSHHVTLDSGAEVDILFQDLGKLIQGDAVPKELTQIALQQSLAPGEAVRKIFEQIEAGETEKTMELARQLDDLDKWMVSESVVHPKLSRDDVDELPPGDVEMLCDIIGRRRKTDAKGVFLGIVPLDLFTTFRDLHKGNQDENHQAGLDPDCPACQSGVELLSDVGEGQL